RGQDPGQPAARFPARAGPSRHRRGRVRRHVRAHHAPRHPGGDRRRDPRRAPRRDAARDSPGRRPLRRGRARQPGRAVPCLGAHLRASGSLHRRRLDLFGAGARAARRGRADARRVLGGGRARGPSPGDPRPLPETVTRSLALLVLGLLVAGTSAAVGVAAAAVSQLELPRWVSYKLRGASGAAPVLERPGRVVAVADTLNNTAIITGAYSMRVFTPPNT